MVKNGRIILTEKQVLQKIKRIAYEIYENNFSEKQIWIAGVHDQGYLFAQLLTNEITAISSLKVKLLRVRIDKKDPANSQVELDQEIEKEKMNSLILVDDVLNTGKTLAYSLKRFLTMDIDKIETAVLVNRKHSQFPISASYTGYELATTITDHVHVVLKEKSKTVYLID